MSFKSSLTTLANHWSRSWAVGATVVECHNNKWVVFSIAEISRSSEVCDSPVSDYRLPLALGLPHSVPCHHPAVLSFLYWVVSEWESERARVLYNARMTSCIYIYIYHRKGQKKSLSLSRMRVWNALSDSPSMRCWTFSLHQSQQCLRTHRTPALWPLHTDRRNKDRLIIIIMRHD